MIFYLLPAKGLTLRAIYLQYDTSLEKKKLGSASRQRLRTANCEPFTLFTNLQKKLNFLKIEENC